MKADVAAGKQKTGAPKAVTGFKMLERFPGCGLYLRPNEPKKLFLQLCVFRQRNGGTGIVIRLRMSDQLSLIQTKQVYVNQKSDIAQNLTGHNGFRQENVCLEIFLPTSSC